MTCSGASSSRRKTIRILVSYVTAGTGHRRAAEAIADAARHRYPHAAVVCVDLLTYTPAWLRWLYPRVYTWLVRYVPTFWGCAYVLLDQPWMFRACQVGRRVWNRIMARRFLDGMRREPPDVVLVTHFFPADVLARARRAGWLSSRLIIVVTDLFPHRLWIVPEADAVVVGSSQTAALCQARGIPPERLHALGIPVGTKFSTLSDRQPLVRQLGIEPERRTILIASGGMGVGPIEVLMRRLMALEAERPKQLQLLIVCGDNAHLARRLQSLGAGAPMPIRVFGFVDTMPELMQASDILVTKAGGLTIMEALVVGLPMILCGTIPGQEWFNAEYLVSRRAAVNAVRPPRVLEVIQRWLDHPDELEAVRANALALGKPRAAQDIIEQLVRTDGAAP